MTAKIKDGGQINMQWMDYITVSLAVVVIACLLGENKLIAFEDKIIKKFKTRKGE